MLSLLIALWSVVCHPKCVADRASVRRGGNAIHFCFPCDSAGAARKRMTLFGKDHRVEPDPPGDLLPLEAGEVDDEVPHLVP